MADRRKELKEGYKNNPPPMGAYLLRNKANGKVFVGGSLNLPGRKNSHYFQLKLNGHPNKALQADWNVYGEAAFSFEVLETLKAEALPRETWSEAVAELAAKWLERLAPYGDRGYNKQKM